MEAGVSGVRVRRHALCESVASLHESDPLSNNKKREVEAAYLTSTLVTTEIELVTTEP